MIEDLTGLGKAMEGAARIADSQLANKVYGDGLQEPVRQTGELATDILKTFRLFTAPFQLAAAYQDRLKSFCDRVRAGVPEERQVEASPAIAGPIMLEMRFIEDASPLADMYEKLLQKAIDRDYQDLAHPAFVKIIGQLSADEVVVLETLRTGPIKARLGYDLTLRCQTAEAQPKCLVLPIRADLDFCMSHLQGLNLTFFADDPDNDGRSGEEHFGLYWLSEFGQRFIQACVA